MASLNTAELEVKVRGLYHNHVTTHNRTYDPSNVRDRRSLPDSADGVAKPVSRRWPATSARPGSGEACKMCQFAPGYRRSVGPDLDNALR
jgi:hypothetical protein